VVIAAVVIVGSFVEEVTRIMAEAVLTTTIELSMAVATRIMVAVVTIATIELVSGYSSNRILVFHEPYP
jgi:hypothetical protein